MIPDRSLTRAFQGLRAWWTEAIAEPEWDPDDREPFGSDTVKKMAERRARLEAAQQRWRELVEDRRRRKNDRND